MGTATTSALWLARLEADQQETTLVSRRLILDERPLRITVTVQLNGEFWRDAAGPVLIVTWPKAAIPLADMSESLFENGVAVVLAA